MTVTELIKQLETLNDQNMKVVLDWHGHPFEVKGISVDTIFEGLLIGDCKEGEEPVVVIY